MPERNDSSADRRRLVLVEKGGTITIPEDEHYDETFIVAQLPTEPAVEFAARAMQRIAAAERAGQTIHQTVFCTGLAFEPQISAARRLIAHGVAAHGEAFQIPGELVVAAPAFETLAQREAWLDQADDLLQAAVAHPLSARLRFRESAAEQTLRVA